MANELMVELRQVSPSTSEVTIRNHRVMVDRPADKGGADQGPMGGELFLSSIGGCFMSNLLAAMRARGDEISQASARVTGTLDGTPARFVSVRIDVTAEAADPDLLDHLVTVADRGCIMMNTLRDKLDVQIRVHGTARIGNES